MDWINVKEKLPTQTRREESDKVLVYLTDINGNKKTELMSYNHVQGFWKPRKQLLCNTRQIYSTNLVFVPQRTCINDFK